MTNGLDFPVEKPGFPVKIGGVELWFDDSVENAINFIEADKIIQQKLEDLQKEADDIKLPVDVENIELDSLSKVDAEKGLDIMKKVLTIQYDTILGDGSFDKIYEKNKDVRQLDDLFPIIDQAITQVFVEREKNRPKITEAKKAEYLNKKAKKVGD